MEGQSCQSLEEQLRTCDFLILAPRGVSMWPLLRNGKDSVRIEPIAPDTVLQVGQVPVYRRSDGQVVLHRIRKICPQGYLICGDHQSKMELVPFCCVFGVMTGYYRKEKYHALTEWGYRLYVKLYCGAPLWLRRILLWCADLPRRLYGGLRRLFAKK